MAIRIFLLTAFIIFSFSAICQERSDKLDFRVGTGISLLGTGDMITFNYENEINLKLNQYFTSSFSLNLGRSSFGVFEMATFTQGNLNVFISPFKNTRRFDFRIGTGLTYYDISDARLQSAYYTNGTLIDVNYKFNKRNSIGYSIIIENSYLLTNRVLLGWKLFSQPYFNGDINTGLLLKVGIKISN